MLIQISNASVDKFDFSVKSSPLASAISFVGADPLVGNSQSSARIDTSGSATVLQIDVDGDGQMTSADMQVQLIGFEWRPAQSKLCRSVR